MGFELMPDQSSATANLTLFL